MDFSNVTLFGKKKFSDLLKEIHTNQKDKEVQLRSLIEGLKPLISSPGEATMIVPLIKEYMELAIKNDDALIKMAGIVQRAMNSKMVDSEELLSDEDKEMLFSSLQELDSKVEIKQIEPTQIEEATNAG
ncbi:hypothetical protein OAE25_00070 [Verrucomicrobiales bacterium]|jgi:hypothetical protein|nr:hypothetical protein [Verrucomicrobiales bacterium]|tara:strand:- start:265 stop:651 length:387 start_codon:yes stop_codon:yes gene_type:complete